MSVGESAERERERERRGERTDESKMGPAIKPTDYVVDDGERAREREESQQLHGVSIWLWLSHIQPPRCVHWLAAGLTRSLVLALGTRTRSFVRYRARPAGCHSRSPATPFL